MPEPLIELEQGGFGITFLKEKYTNKLTPFEEPEDRQRKAILYIGEHGSISNTQYRELAGVSKRTATGDLQELMKKNSYKNLEIPEKELHTLNQSDIGAT